VPGCGGSRGRLCGREPANADDAARYLSSTGARALAIACDVCDETQVKAAVAATVEHSEGGHPDQQRREVQSQGRSRHAGRTMAGQVDVILTGAFLFTQHSARAMIDGARGAASSTSSPLPAIQGEPRMSPTARPSAA
jgi:NAD(P)-dependent dehydrogenase (short-subunit alcohol dehydrogenase family)